MRSARRFHFRLTGASCSPTPVSSDEFEADRSNLTAETHFPTTASTKIAASMPSASIANTSSLRNLKKEFATTTAPHPQKAIRKNTIREETSGPDFSIMLIALRRATLNTGRPLSSDGKAQAIRPIGKPPRTFHRAVYTAPRNRINRRSQALLSAALQIFLKHALNVCGFSIAAVD